MADIYRAIWPVEDDSMKLVDLIVEATEDMSRLMAGSAERLSPVRWRTAEVADRIFLVGECDAAPWNAPELIAERFADLLAASAIRPHPHAMEASAS